MPNVCVVCVGQQPRNSEMLSLKGGLVVARVTLSIPDRSLRDPVLSRFSPVEPGGLPLSLNPLGQARAWILLLAKAIISP